MIQALFSRLAASALWTVVAALAVALVLQGPARAQTEPYTINPGDVLVISVLEDPELDSQVLVLPDGTFSFPIVGATLAEGRTPAELAAFLRRKLAGNFVEPPNVNVAVTQLSAAAALDDIVNVYVLGEVARPGQFQVPGDQGVDVLRALALAGGLGPFAATTRIQVRIPVTGQSQALRLFDYSAIEDGRVAAGFDLELLPDGTVILVPERGLFE